MSHRTWYGQRPLPAPTAGQRGGGLVDVVRGRPQQAGGRDLVGHEGENQGPAGPGGPPAGPGGPPAADEYGIAMVLTGERQFQH